MATRRKRQWSREELAFVRENSGFSQREIAARLGRTVRSVEGVRRRARLNPAAYGDVAITPP